MLKKLTLTFKTSEKTNEMIEEELKKYPGMTKSFFINWVLEKYLNKTQEA